MTLQEKLINPISKEMVKGFTKLNDLRTKILANRPAQCYPNTYFSPDKLSLKFYSNNLEYSLIIVLRFNNER
jgi:hypothetical protein